MDDVAVVKETEAERVAGWRLKKLLGAGYSDEHAAEISERNDIDLHYAVALVVEQGCSADIAARILL